MILRMVPEASVFIEWTALRNNINCVITKCELTLLLVYLKLAKAVDKSSEAREVISGSLWPVSSFRNV